MRNLFGKLIAEHMRNDPDAWLLTGDLGFGVLNEARETVPERSRNVGAAEQLMLGAAVGLAHSGKKPVCYSISPFVIFRPYEYLRNYLNHEGTNVKLVGAGRDQDYGNLGFSHWAVDDKAAFEMFENISTWHPENEEELEENFNSWINSSTPSYLNLKR